MRFVLLVCAVAACHSPPPHKPGEEYLKSVQFQGNKHFKKGDLLDGLAMHRTEQAGRAPDPYQVKTDEQRLRGQYLRDGFLEIDVQSTIERKAEAATVTYKIDEGVRAQTRVVITGLPDDPELTAALVRRQLPIPDGAPFNYQVYDDSKQKVMAVIQDAGYARAKVDASVDGDLPTHTAVVTYAVTPGPKCTFGKVTIKGIGGDLRDSVESRLHFKTGQQYSTKAVAATQRDIYGMSRFSTVQVQPDNGTGGVVDMEVAVSESARHQLTFGGGFGADPISYEVRGRAGYVIAGFPNDLDTLTLDFRPAYAYLRDGSGYEPRVRALARIDRLDLFLTHAKGSVEVGYSYLAYEAFTLFGPEAQIGYEVPLGTKRVTLRAGYQIQQYGFSHPSSLLDADLQKQIGIDHNELLGAFKQTLVVDLRDHPVEPTFGAYAEFQFAEAGSYAGSQYTYQEFVPEVRGYLPLGPVVLAAKAKYGQITGDVPPTERFYAGGATSNRGFAERELSPSITGMDTRCSCTLTVPYGGGGMIDTSIEARFPIMHIKGMPLHGVTFLDGGDVTDKPSQLDVSNLNWAAGLGLRLLTIVGPVRVDFGYRLNRTGPDDPEPMSKWAFHLSLGEAF